MGSSVVRGIRGAINVVANDKAEILEATRELLVKISQENNIQKEDIASVFFTLTPDLNAVFPAAAARELGWDEVPLLCASEVDVPGALPLCIRVMMHVNTTLHQSQVRHIYLREARNLRADLADNT